MRVDDLGLARRLATRRTGYRRVRLFRPDVQRTLRRYGYCVTDVVVPHPDLDRLRSLTDEFLDSVDARPAERFTPIHPNLLDPPRTDVMPAFDEVLAPTLARLTTPDALWATSVFQVKPSGPESQVDAHQDPALVDERRWFGAYLWICLGDVDAASGAMYAVPGSHRFGAWHRGPATGGEFELLRGAIFGQARLLEARAGQVVVFDHALVHGSLPNRSGNPRIAVGGVVRPRRADIVMPARRAGAPAGALDLYRYPPHVRMSRQDEARRLRQHAGVVRGAELDVTPDAFRAVCRIDRVLHPGAPGRPVPASALAPADRRPAETSR